LASTFIWYISDEIDDQNGHPFISHP
jgi:hypothetical protein